MKKIALASIALSIAALPALAGVLSSGLSVGDTLSAFEPHHLSGPDKGTDTCPVCKYGARPAVQVWSNMDTESNLRALAVDLNNKVGSSKHDLKAFVINIASCPNDKDGKACAHCNSMIAGYAKSFKTDHVALATIAEDSDAIKDYKINTSKDVKNTVFVYKDRKVVAKFVNLKADAAGLKALNMAVASVDK